MEWQYVEDAPVIEEMDSPADEFIYVSESSTDTDPDFDPDDEANPDNDGLEIEPDDEDEENEIDEDDLCPVLDEDTIEDFENTSIELGDGTDD